MAFTPSGSWVAIPTPMKSDRSVDLDGFRRLIDMHAECGTNALLIGGSAGEVATLDPSERRAIIKDLAPYARDKIATFFSSGANTTDASITLTKFAEDQGALGVVQMVPSYVLPTQSAVLDHLAAIAESVQIPIALYNNPARVGVNVDPETIVAVNRAHANFAIDKEAVPSPEQIHRVIELSEGRMSVLCCDNPHYGLMPMSVTIASGMANIAGNLDPAEMAELSKPLTDNMQIERWKRRYFRFLPLMRLCYMLPNPVIVKAAMNALGLPAGPLRKPLQAAHGSILNEVKRVVAEYRLGERYRQYLSVAA